MAAETQRTLLDVGLRHRRAAKVSKAKAAPDLSPSKQASVQPQPDAKPAPVCADLEALRAFDHDYDYGPKIGMSRLERWERAEKLGLNPDPKIKEIIEKHQSDSEYTECVWYQYKGLQVTS